MSFPRRCPPYWTAKRLKNVNIFGCKEINLYICNVNKKEEEMETGTVKTDTEKINEYARGIIERCQKSNPGFVPVFMTGDGKSRLKPFSVGQWEITSGGRLAVLDEHPENFDDPGRFQELRKRASNDGTYGFLQECAGVVEGGTVEYAVRVCCDYRDTSVGYDSKGKPVFYYVDSVSPCLVVDGVAYLAWDGCGKKTYRILKADQPLYYGEERQAYLSLVQRWYDNGEHEPNRVGKPTRRKVEAWVSYWARMDRFISDGMAAYGSESSSFKRLWKEATGKEWKEGKNWVEGKHFCVSAELGADGKPYVCLLHDTWDSHIIERYGGDIRKALRTMGRLEDVMEEDNETV